MSTAADTDTDAVAQVRTRLEAWAEALRAKDIDGVIANYAPGLRSFDCHSHLQLAGADAYRRHLAACFPYVQGGMSFEFRDLDIMAEGDLAFCHYLAAVGSTGLDGTRHDCLLRATVCLRRIDGRWLIVHDHLSAPFNPETGTAMLDLRPDAETRAATA